MQTQTKIKIQELRQRFPNLFSREKDDYVLNAVIVESNFYKDPSHVLDENSLKRIIVDGKNDGGIDCILTDLDSDHGDLIIVQCKCYETISPEQIKDAINKMYGAYKNLIDRKNSSFKEKLVEQFSECEDQMDDEAKTIFYFCTTAPRAGIKTKTIQNYFDSVVENQNIQLEILFQQELEDRIVEFNSLKRTVDADKIKIDKSNNILKYFEQSGSEWCDAIIVNGSANSIKELFARHHLALFDQNLRYYVRSKNIDLDIKSSIDKTKEKFWYKNNGITIIAEDFDISGNIIKLKKFSIINGGQTTHLIGKNDSINENNDFYLPIKIIKAQGINNDEKQGFVFDIAIATNSQKAIKPSDLKANRPEQISFFEALKQVKVFYKTKRGQEIPSAYKSKENNCDLPKVTKLILAGVFLMPGTSRSNPSIVYKDDQPFYDDIFRKNLDVMPKTVRDLLYIDKYFADFKKKYTNETKKASRILFANNARTLCLAFCGFLAKYLNNYFTEKDLNILANADCKNEDHISKIKRILSDPSQISGIFNKQAIESSKDELDKKLYKIFSFICKIGSNVYSSIPSNERKNETNWLKSDSSFYRIICENFDDIKEETEEENEIYSIFKKE